MTIVFVNEPQIQCLSFIRIALSERTKDEKLKAIVAAKHDIVASLLERLLEDLGPGGIASWLNAELIQWVAETSPERHEAALEFQQISQRYEKANERKLNVAEHIGKLIWNSIRDGRYQGLHTKTGILDQVRHVAKRDNIRYAKDVTGLRDTWKSYRGVIHLGMAMDYCESNPKEESYVLDIAERFRRGLSENCPKGTKNPYVEPDDQFSFVYLSKPSGPRFGNRRLPFEVT